MVSQATLTVPGAVYAPDYRYFLIFDLDDDRYAVALESVERVVRAFAPARLPEGPSYVSGLLDLHGRVIPLLDLRRIFGLQARGLQSRDYFIITAGEAEACALAADSVPRLTACRPDELLAAGPEAHGRYIDRVIRKRDGIILVFDPLGLPRGGVASPGTAGGGR